MHILYNLISINTIPSGYIHIRKSKAAAWLNMNNKWGKHIMSNTLESQNSSEKGTEHIRVELQCRRREWSLSFSENVFWQPVLNVVYIYQLVTAAHAHIDYIIIIILYVLRIYPASLKFAKSTWLETIKRFQRALVYVYVWVFFGHLLRL